MQSVLTIAAIVSFLVASCLALRGRRGIPSGQCPSCTAPNPRTARYCRQCGQALQTQRAVAARHEPPDIRDLNAAIEEEVQQRVQQQVGRLRQQIRQQSQQQVEKEVVARVRRELQRREAQQSPEAVARRRLLRVLEKPEDALSGAEREFQQEYLRRQAQRLLPSEDPWDGSGLLDLTVEYED